MRKLDSKHVYHVRQSNDIYLLIGVVFRGSALTTFMKERYASYVDALVSRRLKLMKKHVL